MFRIITFLSVFSPIHNNVLSLVWSFMVRCAIWYHLHNLKIVKNTHGGVLILVELQALAYKFTKINTPPLAFLIFF